MMPRVELTLAARTDLYEIHAYLAHEAGHDVADRILGQVIKTLELLSTNNLIGTPRPELIPNLRSFPKGKYNIFYFPKDFGVEIYRVLHSARDIDQIFEDEYEN